MDDISSGMKSLSEDILSAHRNRKDRIQDLKVEAEVIRKEAARFLNESRTLHEEMGRSLKTGLKEGRESLLREVSTMRDEFRQKEREVKADLAEAKRLWNDMRSILGGERND